MNNELERRAVALEFLQLAARLGQPGTEIFMKDEPSPDLREPGVRYVTVGIGWYNEPTTQFEVLSENS